MMARSFVWILVVAVLYGVVMLYWARLAARENGKTGFFSAAHGLAPWISAVALTGASLSAWALLGGGAALARYGFSQPVWLVAGITLALPGVIFFKRIWFIGRRLGLSSQTELFQSVYNSPTLAVVSALTALLFAIGFSGLQMRALSGIVAALSDGQVSPIVTSAALALITAGVVVIGGMRAIAYTLVLQTVLLVGAVVGLAACVFVFFGSFPALVAKLRLLATATETAHLFTVAGVVQFTPGLGRGADASHASSAMMNFSLALAMMGFQAGPLALKLVLSTARPTTLAAGQTWILAGFGGLIVAVGLGLVGAGAFADSRLGIVSVLGIVADGSPWFTAIFVVGLIAGVQAISSLSLFVAAEAVIKHVYTPYFHSALTPSRTVTLSRICVAVLAAASVILQSLTPVTLSAIGALALPVSLQLWTPLLGMTWLPFISSAAATAGVGFGIAAVLLTEPLGYHLLAYVGVELPWGRWPWTIHSAAWGLAANTAVVLLVSAISTRRTRRTEAAVDIGLLFSKTLRTTSRARSLTATAWSLSLVWLFFALGPGLVFGNFAFGEAAGDRGWIFGLPSLWVWAVLAWMTGLGLVWFLAYRVEMAATSLDTLAMLPARPRLVVDSARRESRRIQKLLIATAIVFSVITVLKLGFGR